MLEINGIVGGTYQVIQEIGHGGTGVVYLAYHLNLQKYIVLKRITSQISSMEGLRREADILKNLRHTNIPQIYDFLIENGEVFTVMDYIEGRSLGEYIQGANRYSEDQLISWMRDLTDVLVYLQSRHPAVIHSDIKPENIIITPQNVPVLIDFNISIDQTAGGRAAGFSPAYASPEQAYMAMELKEGRSPGYALDGRTDIYSLGAVFYALITGMKPDSRYVLPKLEQMQGLIYSQAFLAVVDRCVEWEREKRFRNATKLSAAVANLYRMDKRYKKYTAVRAASWILSALIFASGCFCILHGVRLNDKEKAESLYASITEATSTGDFTTAGKAANEILSSRGMRSSFDDSGRAELYHVAGDAAYTEGNYGEAADNYRSAVELAESGSSERLTAYYSDLAVAYLKSGESEALYKLSQTCREMGLESDDIRLMEASAMQQNGDMEGSLSEAELLIDKSDDASVKAKACVLAAGCFGKNEPEKKLKYMRMAVEYSDEVRYARECAALEYENAGRTGISDSERRAYAERAVRQYEKLCKTAAPQTTDLMNLGISCYYAAEYSKALDVLAKAGKSSTDYRIPMYQALSAEGMGNDGLAREYCSRAMTACKEQKIEGWEEDYETLKTMSARLF